MKMNLKSIIIIAIICISSNVYANTVKLKKHTTIPVRLTQNINGNLDHQGDTVYFEVLEDIKVNNHVVISKGTFATGKITNAETRKSMGKAGKLTIDARSLHAVDGQIVDIVRDAMTSEGRKRTGATVAHVIMWGPLGLFAKGRAARIMLDSEYDIEVDSDFEIDVSKVNNSKLENKNDSDLDVYFMKHKGKINYAKGKVGNDFYLNIVLPESTNLSTKDIEIIDIQGHNLPKPIKPTSVQWNKKSNSFTATIAFSDMVKYISPGNSEVKVKVSSDDKTMIGEANVETKWKLK
jgi:hypothetical protein